MRIPRSLLVVALASGGLPFLLASPAVAGQGELIALGPVLTTPRELDTSGDYATDVYSDPWDFSNAEDVLPVAGVGTSLAGTPTLDASAGVLTVRSLFDTQVRLVMDWTHTPPPVETPVLPWGRDGWKNPIDGGLYSVLDMRVRTDEPLHFAIRWWNAAGQFGAIPFDLTNGDWQNLHFDLNDRSLYKLADASAVWGGPIVRLELSRSYAVRAPGTQSVDFQLDWVRLRRADAADTPPARLAVPLVVSPNEEGGADFATTVRGNAWDFAGPDDVLETHDVTGLDYSTGNLTGTSTGNDPYVEVPVDSRLMTDKYHRFTADVCYGGPFGLADAPGGGMNGRVSWMQAGSGRWSETQDFLVFPGCQKISIDLATTPAFAVADEGAPVVTGWRGVALDRFRFDLHEDPGARAFTVQNLKLADDAAFTDTYNITFKNGGSVASATADIFVTTSRGSFNGTQIARGLTVGAGLNTFTWNGKDVSGTQLPNAAYWVYIVMRTGAGAGVGVSTGPVRLERAVPSTPSYFVPLTPARLLDTRTGEGGNIAPLGSGVSTQLRVAGVGGVPVSGATAVVMNLTAVAPTSGGFLTAWPSGEPRPTVSNVNFVPGQTVPNLATVKLGANGNVDIFNNAGNTHVIADVVGYYTTTAPQSGGRFSAVTPARILDTRSGVGAPAATIGQNRSIDLTVTGVGGVPSTGVDAVALNVTVDQPTGQGFLTVWPTGVARPLASTHNFVPTLTVANMVIAKVGANGQISIYNSSGDSHVVADVVGYYSSNGGLFVPVTPQRLADSREGSGGSSTMGFQTMQSISIANANPMPVNAGAAVVNVTSVDSATTGFMTAWPQGSEMPVASTLNPRPGVAVPNLAYLKVGDNGGLSFYNSTGQTNYIVDIFGYITSPK